MNVWKNVVRKIRKKKYAGAMETMWRIAPDMTADQFVEAYGKIGWLFACASTRANAVASQKMRVYKLDSQSNQVEIWKHPLISLLNKPNPYLTGYKLKQLTQLFLDLLGESFWIIERNRLGEPAEIWVVNPANMWVIPDKENFIKAWVYKSNGEEIPIDPDDVIHLYYPDPKNPYRGIGPAQAAAIDLDSNDYANQWNRNFFFNSARPDGIIEVPRVLQESEYQAIVEHWNAAHSGVNNAHRVGLLEVGQYKQIGISPKDMDFSSLQAMTRDKILGIFGVPKIILGLTDNVNRATAEAADYIFAKWTVKPLLDSFADDINFQLVPKFKDTSIEVAFDNPVPDNIEQLLMKWEKGWNKWLTVNEIREEQGKEPLEGGDIIYIPISLMPMNMGDNPLLETDGEKNIQYAVLKKKSTGSFEVKKKAKAWLSGLNKEQYWNAFVNKAENFQKKVEPIWQKTFERQKQQIISNLHKQKGIKSININDVLSFLMSSNEKNRIFDSLQPMLQEILKDKGQEFLSDIDSNISFDVTSPSVQKWIEKYCGKQIGKINDTTRDLIRNQISQGEENGESIDQIADKIGEYFDVMDKWRVNTIARTETISASNAGTLEGYRQSKVISKKEWLTAIDERTRESHILADGQVREIDEDFDVGSGHGPAPGQIGLAEEDVNCRCTILPVID